MNSLRIGILAGAIGCAAAACSASSGGGSGTGGAGGTVYGTGATGNVSGTGATGTGATGAVGGGNTGGVGNTGGGNTGGVGNTGGGNTGGVGNTGGGGNITLPAGCVTDSSVQIQCNPLTLQGCTGAGETCDIGSDPQSGASAFQCFPPPNDVPPNGACDNKTGPYCQPKYGCKSGADGGTGACKKMCCSTADCGGSGTCQPLDPNFGSFGNCI